MTHHRRTSERRGCKYPHRTKPHFSSFTKSFCVSQRNYCSSSQDFAQTFLNSVGAVSSPCFFATAVRGRKSYCVSIPHSYTPHIKHSVVLRLQKTYSFNRCMSPSTNTNSMKLTQKNLLMINFFQLSPTREEVLWKERYLRFQMKRKPQCVYS